MARIALVMTLFLAAQFSAESYGQAGTSEGWFVLQRTNPSPTSRTDWVGVGKADAQGDGWLIVPRAPRSSTSWAQAVADADAYRMYNDRFQAVCDKRYKVIRAVGTGALAATDGSVPSGYVLDRGGLCCEDAFEIAFPTAAGTAPASNDCRTFRLQSVPGASVRLTPGGWRATGGSSITIATNPPTVVPLPSPAVSGPPGGSNCRTVRKQIQPESRDATGKITVEAAMVHVLNCPTGEMLVYEYLNRPGFRAIRPPDWGHALGGRDFSSFDQAQQAAATAGQANPPGPERTCPDGSIALMGVCSDGGARPGTNQGAADLDLVGSWASSRPGNVLSLKPDHTCVWRDSSLRPDWTGTWSANPPGSSSRTLYVKLNQSDRYGPNRELTMRSDGKFYDAWGAPYTRQ